MSVGNSFLHRVNTILDRLAFGHKLNRIGPKCHQRGTRTQPKYHANHTVGQSLAGSERQVATKTSCWQQMGGTSVRKRWHQVLSISRYFLHSVIEINHNSFFKDCHDVRVAFGVYFAYICLTFLEPSDLFFDDGISVEPSLGFIKLWVLTSISYIFSF